MVFWYVARKRITCIRIFFLFCLFKCFSLVVFCPLYIFSLLSLHMILKFQYEVTLILLRKIFTACRLSSQALVKDICLLFFSSQFGKNVRKCNLSHESTLPVNVSFTFASSICITCHTMSMFLIFYLKKLYKFIQVIDFTCSTY